ncbi:hypothetical protein [Pseudomonas sp.]|uniref:hypothetical protein n=1 Tax=Pseudomonas sp. TaxID=306 RepID=UPI00289C1EF5|nr:hypothetical protein [Pseudomonas sp.]
MSHAAALHWIVDQLNQRRIPFLLCGGLAAHVYGARRPLNDIDLLIPADRLQEIAAAGAAVTTKPLERRCEEGWDVEYVQFKVEGVKIEIGGTPVPGFSIRATQPGETLRQTWPKPTPPRCWA